MEQPRQIVIETGQSALRAVLLPTRTAELLWSRLPVEGRGERWGDEIFLSLPADLAIEADARQVVEPGSLCYWCEGRILSIALGPTPISLKDECRLVAPVNVWGRLDGDMEPLRSFEPGSTLRVLRWEP